MAGTRLLHIGKTQHGLHTHTPTSQCLSSFNIQGVSKKLQLAIANKILRAILGDQIWGKSEPKYHHDGPKWPKLA